MEDLIEAAISSKTEYDIANYYLATTKRVIKCTNINEKKLIFSVFNEEKQIYEKTEGALLGNLVRKELISNLTTVLKSKNLSKKKYELICKLIMKLGSQNFITNLVKT